VCPDFLSRKEVTAAETDGQGSFTFLTLSQSSEARLADDQGRKLDRLSPRRACAAGELAVLFADPFPAVDGDATRTHTRGNAIQARHEVGVVGVLS